MTLTESSRKRLHFERGDSRLNTVAAIVLLVLLTVTGIFIAVANGRQATASALALPTAHQPA